MRPNALDVMFVVGTSRFSVLNRFENAISNRRRDGDPTRNDLPTVIEKSAVPGPINSPTAHVPNRPMLAAGRTNALFVNHASAVGPPTLPSPTQSGRWVDV